MNPERPMPDELTETHQNSYSESMPEAGETPAGAIPPENNNEPEKPAPLEQTIEDLHGAPIRVPETESPSSSEAAKPESSSEKSRLAAAEAKIAAYEKRISDMEKRLEKAGRGEKAPDFPTLENPINDPVLASHVKIINGIGEDIVSDPYIVDELKRSLAAKLSDPATQEEARLVNDFLDRVSKYAVDRSNYNLEGSRRTFSLTLTLEDFRQLEDDPNEWLSGQIDRIYDYSSEGSELDGVQLRAVQQAQEVASRYLVEAGKDAGEIKAFNEEFLTTLNNMIGRVTVQQRNMEGAQGTSKKTGVHQIMNALSYEHGMVGVAFNRIQGVYDDVRVRSKEHHITPESHSQIQQIVIDELVKQAEMDTELGDRLLGLGDYWKNKEKNQPVYSQERRRQLIQAAARRSVRRGYDVFVFSQREAVTVSRGDALPFDKSNLDALLGDPSGLFMVYNYEQLLIEKFGILSAHEQHFFSALKRRYAESVLEGDSVNLDEWTRKRIADNPDIVSDLKHELGKNPTKKQIREAALVDYGTGLMNELMAVNDFYSAGWRAEKIIDQLDDIMKYQTATRGEVKRKISDLTQTEIAQAKENAANFGLFMRLRYVGHDPKLKNDNPEVEKQNRKQAKIDLWKKLAVYRPEDTVKLFRESGTEAELQDVNQAILSVLFEVTPAEAAAGITLYDKFEANKTDEYTTPYDMFKEKYGAALSHIRNQGIKQDLPEQVDFSQISTNTKYFDLLVKALGPEEAAKIEQVYKVMSKFAGNDTTINKLITDARFGRVYSRTYSVEDALLDRMEDESQDARAAGFISVSKKLGPESGADAFARSYNDTVNANEAYTSFLKFLTTESVEEKTKAAVEAAAATERYRDPGQGALVFRYTMGSYMLMGQVSEGKMGYVYEVLDINRLPLRKEINELQRIFGPQAPSYNNDQLRHWLDEHHNDLVGGHGPKAERAYKEMERLTRTDGKGRAEIQAGRAIVFTMLFLMLEGFDVVKEGLENEEIK